MCHLLHTQAHNQFAFKPSPLPVKPVKWTSLDIPFAWPGAGTVRDNNSWAVLKFILESLLSLGSGVPLHAPHPRHPRWPHPPHSLAPIWRESARRNGVKSVRHKRWGKEAADKAPHVCLSIAIYCAIFAMHRVLAKHESSLPPGLGQPEGNLCKIIARTPRADHLLHFRSC